MGLFGSFIESKLKNSKENRYVSVNSFAEYLTLLGYTGKIDDIYISLRLVDKAYIDKNIEALKKHGVYNNLESLLARIEKNNSYGIKDYILNKQHDEFHIYNLLSNFLNDISKKGSTHEDNFVLNYLLNLAIYKKVLDKNISIKLVNHFWDARNCNNYRKDYCVFTIVDYCIEEGISDLFTLRKQYYDHIQKIYTRIYRSSFLSKDEKTLFQLHYNSKLKQFNNLKSKTKNKVAVCISGLYRNHTHALESIREYIVEPLNADVFVHTWDDKSIWTGIGGNPDTVRLFGADSKSLVPREISDLHKIQDQLPNIYNKIKSPIFEKWDGKEITDVLNPHSIIIEDQIHFEDSILDKRNYLLARGSMNQIKMFHGMKKSFDLALENGNYDYIIRIRPDILVDSKITLEDISNLDNNTIYTNIGHFGLQDFEFVLSSSMAHNLSRFILKMFDFNALSPYDSFPLYDAHNLMMSWMIEYNYTFDNDLYKRFLTDMTDRKISIKGLNEAIETDYNNLPELNKPKFLPFLEYLKTNYC